jgi:hypothetical protein
MPDILLHLRLNSNEFFENPVCARHIHHSPNDPKITTVLIIPADKRLNHHTKGRGKRLVRRLEFAIMFIENEETLLKRAVLPVFKPIII